MLFACFIVNRKLDIMRSADGNMQALILLLNQSCEQAHASVKSLKQACLEADAKLSGQLHQGKKLTSELDIMLGSGERLADKISGGLASTKLSAVIKKDKVSTSQSIKKPTDEEVTALTKLLQGLK